jgi:callose synthase
MPAATYSFSVLILQLARELEEVVLRKQTAEPAESCKFNDDVSFLDKVISPLYEILAAVSAAAI